MNTIVPSKEQSKHSAADIFIAFEYQWDSLCYHYYRKVLIAL